MVTAHQGTQSAINAGLLLIKVIQDVHVRDRSGQSSGRIGGRGAGGRSCPYWGWPGLTDLEQLTHPHVKPMPLRQSTIISDALQIHSHGSFKHLSVITEDIRQRQTA